MSIVLARIDDRLIHGQVMTSWLNYTGANEIIVIDDVTASDPFLKMILKSLVPANIVIEVVKIEDSVELVSKLKKSDKVIILAKSPAAYMYLIENGIELPKINIGGMGIHPGRKTIYKNISASDEEKEQLKSMLEKGIVVEIQMVAEDTAISVKNYI